MFELNYYYPNNTKGYIMNCDDASLDGDILELLEDGVIKIELNGEVIYDET